MRIIGNKRGELGISRVRECRQHGGLSDMAKARHRIADFSMMLRSCHFLSVHGAIRDLLAHHPRLWP
ncbi:MAG: hypothetical protein ACREQO_16950, partial [Candidatus Binatia bacterium]